MHSLHLVVNSTLRLTILFMTQEGEATEEMEEDNKSILWALLKQVMLPMKHPYPLCIYTI